MTMEHRILAFLAAGPAGVSELTAAGRVLIERDGGKRLAASRDAVAGLVRRGLAVRAGDVLELSPEGRASVARRRPGANPFGDQHRDLRAAVIEDQGERRPVTVNCNESPLANLARRRDRAGRPFLAEREFAAGERLRADYARGQLMPRLSANWEASVASRRRAGAVNGIADLTDSALAARQRVDHALQAVGPELAGVLVDVCCFLKGLELVESERGWPVRSAKIVLKAALSALARHYEPPPRPARGRAHHWGAGDYRPVSAFGPDRPAPPRHPA